MISLKKDIDQSIELSHKERLNTGMHPSSAAYECKKRLWLDFRNTKQEKFSGRKLRLFETGHVYESRIISYINNLPHCEVVDSQKRVQEGIIRGNIDGIVLVSGNKYLLEIKTSAQKYFVKLPKVGVKEAFIKHYIQMQIYMHLLGLKKAIYICVNKNTDEIYEEVLDFDEAQAKMYIHRIREIAHLDTVPDKISENPAYFLCKQCPYQKFCHEGEQITPTCRGCKNFSLKDDTAHCSSFEKAIPIEFQHKKQDGIICKSFEVHPDLKYSDSKFDELERDISKYFGSGASRVF